MNPKDFADQIDRARTMLQQHYRSVTVSASYMPVILGGQIFVSVKSPYWTHEMEWREDDAPDTPLSEWIYQEVRAIRTPDIVADTHNRHYARKGTKPWGQDD